MVRLQDLSDAEREHIMGKALPSFAETPFVHGPPLSERRVALITTAGLHRVDDESFSFVDLSHRVIPGDVDLSTLTMTHSSVHFDRTGFQEDVNTVFPLDRLRELADDGVIGSVADHHYSLMGAGWPPEMIEPTCDDLARTLHADEVTAVCLVPV
ncbi:MAG: glycine/sarcosine/betaine reductase selenoprotein B family protein [Acidimicrobiales bacterium]|nr:glycine/sarcosine/betaine reductase selenoprotein B family protein [Acidimicrobiales bacterium]